mgnify:FL=1
MPDNNQNTTSDVPPILEVETNLPPMIHEQSSPPTGSAAPNDDVIMPAVVTTTQKKKFAGGKIIATILGLFILIGGTGAGVFLVGQNQNINEEAKALNLSGSQKNAYDKCREDSGSQVCACRVAGECTRSDYKDDPQSPVYPIVTPAPEKTGGIYTCMAVGKSGNESASQCIGKQNGGNCKIREDGETCSYVGGSEAADIADTPTNPPTITAQCQNIKAYSPTWELLTATQLSALTTGSQVNFCAAGSASSGSFDKAKFTINGAVQTETTTVRPSSTDYCQSYVIPTGTTAFNVTAQIHHITLGWR